MQVARSRLESGLAETPALLTSVSRRPKRRTAWRRGPALPRLHRDVQRHVSTLPLGAALRGDASSFSWAGQHEAVLAAGGAAQRRAISAPMPSEPPVMRMTS